MTTQTQLSSISTIVLLAGLVLPLGSRSASTINNDEQVVFFRTAAHLDEAGEHWIVPIHGWIFAPEEDSLWRRPIVKQLHKLLEVDPHKAQDNPIFKRRAHLFVADSEGGKELSIRIASRITKLPESQKHGQFQGQLTIRTGQAIANVLHYSAVTKRDDKRYITGKVHLVPNEGVSVISDIDDTIKISNVTNKRKLIENTFLKEFEAVPGMVKAYKQWAADGAVFHYVSSSPWQLFPELDSFMHKVGFPGGSCHLQQFRLKDKTFFNLFKSAEESKPAVIESILKTWPKRKFILVGDSGEQDPEIYGGIARKFPEQILQIYIRLLGEYRDAGIMPKRFKSAFKNVPEKSWTLFADAEVLKKLQLGPKPLFTFVQISETHVNPAGGKTLPPAIEEINTLNPDFVVHSGDLTENGLDVEYDNLNRLMAPLKVKWYALPGNHEVTKGPQGNFTKYLKQPLYQAFKHKGYSFILLNGTVDEAVYQGRATIGPEQMKWLEGTLKEAKNDSARFVFCHWRIVDIKKPAQAKVIELLKKHKVAVYVCGHKHRHYFQNIQGVKQLVCGGLAWNFDKLPVGYRIYSVYKDKVVSQWKPLGKPINEDLMYIIPTK